MPIERIPITLTWRRIRMKLVTLAKPGATIEKPSDEEGEHDIDAVFAEDLRHAHPFCHRVAGSTSGRPSLGARALDMRVGPTGRPAIAAAPIASSREFGAREFRDDASVPHDENAVAHPHDLRKLRGDEQDRHAVRGERVDLLPDLGLRADVDAARRLVEDQQRRLACSAICRARPSAGFRRSERRPASSSKRP